MFCCALLCVHSGFAIFLFGREELWLAGPHVPRGGCVSLPRGAMGLSAVCDCGISGSYSLTTLNVRHLRLISHVSHIKHVFFHFVVYLYQDISC